MNTVLLKTNTEDNLELQGLLYEPDTSSSIAVLHIHGMAGNFYANNFLDVMAKQYTSHAIALLSVNTRGRDTISDTRIQSEQNKTSWLRTGNAYEIFKENKLDIDAWVKALINRGYTTIYLQGHSLGSSKVVYYQAETSSPRTAGLILLSPTEMVHYAESNPGHAASVKEAKTLINNGKGSQLLSDPIWEDQFIVSANTYIDFTTRGNPIDVFKGYDRNMGAPIGVINVPVLAVMGLKDNGPKLIGETSEEYLNMLKSKAKKCRSFQSYSPDTTHNYTGHEDEVAEKVIEFIESHQSTI